MSSLSWTSLDALETRLRDAATPVSRLRVLSARANDDADPLIVFRGDSCFVILNLFPYNNGHLMVVPNRHIASLADADAEELGEMMELTRRVRDRAPEAYAPHGINIGHQSRQAGRRRRPRSPPHARGAALERRHELHDGGRRDARVARGTGATAEKLRPIFERLSSR